jgi:hypothetical protein
MLYELISTGNGSSITLLHKGRVYTATNTHPAFALIIEGAVKGDENVTELFDVQLATQKAFDKVSDRISIRNGELYVDGELVDNSLSNQIIRFQQEGVNDFTPLVNFYEKVLTNHNGNSREQLFTWLNDRNFTITQDGDFIAYKGLTQDGLSVHSGKAIVDGVPMEGQIPNAVGSIVEMPRGDVNADPYHGCSYGLHAGTWEYASTFAPRVVKVKINPRDVVSVPRDCDFQKLRTCRYEILAEIDNPDYRALSYDNGDEWDNGYDENDTWDYLGWYEQG